MALLLVPSSSHARLEIQDWDPWRWGTSTVSVMQHDTPIFVCITVAASFVANGCVLTSCCVTSSHHIADWSWHHTRPHLSARAQVGGVWCCSSRQQCGLHNSSRRPLSGTAAAGGRQTYPIYMLLPCIYLPSCPGLMPSTCHTVSPPPPALVACSTWPMRWSPNM
jgi:hypothetical protein